MFFNLNFVETHRIYELQEALLSFFQRCASDTAYNLDCFPEWFQNTLATSDVLRERFQTIANLIQGQEEATRNHILAVFVNNNQIQELCENKNLPLEILDLVEEEIDDDNTVNLAVEIKGLFDYLYKDVLKRQNLFGNNVNLSIRHHHEVFRNENETVCPFCGINTYPDMKAEYDEDTGTYQDRTGKRSSYDHYLFKEYYPLAEVNFRNLVPMCDECNESPNKGSKDILFTTDERDIRREVFYPYNENGEVELSVLCQDWSVYNIKGQWDANITPSNVEDAEKVETWNSVFNIFSRIANRVRGYNRHWLSQCLHDLALEGCDIESLREKFRAEAEKWSHYKKVTGDSIIKVAFFSYLAETATDKQVRSFCKNLSYPKTFKSPN